MELEMHHQHEREDVLLEEIRGLRGELKGTTATVPLVNGHHVLREVEEVQVEDVVLPKET
jgi:hypothetical protein